MAASSAFKKGGEKKIHSKKNYKNSYLYKGLGRLDGGILCRHPKKRKAKTKTHSYNGTHT
jgi:hypothetical protein